MASTLLLDQTAWDLLLDVDGNIALASEPYAQAQDVASQARTFQGECWYDLSQGLPYFAQILGKRLPIPLLKTQYVAAALAVPGIVSAVFFVTGFANRLLQGQIQAKTSTGANVVINSAGGGVFVLDQSLLGGGDVLA